jgi:hypothetical protein
MKNPHKHAEVIKAWADGAEIQSRRRNNDEWCDTPSPSWYKDTEYRIKPEPKPDFSQIMDVYINKMYKHFPDGFRERRLMIDNFALLGAMCLTFDGETGKLKSAEVIE